MYREKTANYLKGVPSAIAKHNKLYIPISQKATLPISDCIDIVSAAYFYSVYILPMFVFICSPVITLITIAPWLYTDFPSGAVLY